MAAVSGTGFGIFFVLLKEAGSHGGLWPLVASRGAGFAVLLTVVAVLGVRPSGFASRTFLLLAIASGVLDAVANVLYFLAAQSGMLSLAAVLASLYPAVTVLLARTVYSERLRMIQQVGMAIALAGIALVTVG
jgi:drug/metabolite transporter (DMT)-like permease